MRNTGWTLLRTLLVVALCATVLFSAIGCEQESPVEEDLEEVGDELDEAADEGEEAVEEMGDAIEEQTDKM